MIYSKGILRFRIFCGIFLIFSGCLPNSQPRYKSFPRSQINRAHETDSGERAKEDSIGGDRGVLPEEAPATRVVAHKTYTLSVSTLTGQLADGLLPYVHSPYKYGGEQVDGVDCSGLVKAVYKDAFNLELPHKAALQFHLGKSVSKKHLLAGDLVFFYHKKWRRINHVGIYLADNRFIHSMSGKGVVISDLGGAYWRKNYAGARRLLVR